MLVEYSSMSIKDDLCGCSGDHDPGVPFLGTQRWVRSFNFSIVDDWRAWHVDGQSAGLSHLTLILQIEYSILYFSFFHSIKRPSIFFYLFCVTARHIRSQNGFYTPRPLKMQFSIASKFSNRIYAFCFYFFQIGKTTLLS
jgi:hypothetical protein